MASSVVKRALRDSRAHAVGVEEDHVPGIPVSEGHQEFVTSRLPSGELHSGNVGEDKTKSCPQFLHAAIWPLA
jgi:hypothetical protein